MTGPNGIYASPHDLIDALQQLVRRHPAALVEKNRVGNLSAYENGEYIGWVDLAFPELHLDEDEYEED